MEYYNATRTITATIGVVLGIAGFNHGFFEALQGNKPVEGNLIQAIGEEHRFWIHGTEEAITLIPNFLITGILSMSISILIIIWSIWYVHKKHGPGIFLLLFLVLTLVGGGIGHFLFYMPVWAYATRINKPSGWWERNLPLEVKRIIQPVWPYTLVLIVVLFIMALEIAVFGYFPGIRDPDTLLYTCWMFLLFALILINITFVAGYLHDNRFNKAMFR